MKINFAKIPALLLALLLQFAPVLKVLHSSSVLASSPFAIVIKFAGFAAVALGGYHAVSGASSVLITSPTNSVGTNGTLYRYVITQNSPNPDSGHAFGAAPRPANLTLSVIQGSAPAIGLLTGTPTNFGVWLVHLTATYNDGGTILSAVPTNMLLTVYGRPIITNQPVGLTNSAGASAAFSVVAGALPQPSYRWRLGTTTLAGQTNATLTVNNISAGDAGNYTVVLSNFVGSITSAPAALAISSGSGPGIGVPPQDASVFVGGSTNFSVIATGTPPLGFFWRKNGTPLPGANSATYSLNSAITNDAGGYSVVVSNSISSVTSSAALLRVVRAPVITSVESAGDQITIRFPQDAGANYTLLHHPSVPVPTNAWLTLTNLPPTAQATNRTVTDSVTNGPARFYELRVTLP